MIKKTDIKPNKTVETFGWMFLDGFDVSVSPLAARKSEWLHCGGTL